MILAPGTASGRKCSNQKVPESGSVHVFLAPPFKPWTATILSISQKRPRSKVLKTDV
jgi:hypothetical protein